jgi:mRNA-degrading endonuclease RelE of RelBE toxin-antitoxin system
MTKPCEKIFKKLPRNQQVDIKAKISEICGDPFKIGYKLLDASMAGFRHVHVGNDTSNVLVVWSVDDGQKIVWIESVGSHHNMEELQNKRKRSECGYSI